MTDDEKAMLEWALREKIREQSAQIVILIVLVLALGLLLLFR